MYRRSSIILVLILFLSLLSFGFYPYEDMVALRNAEEPTITIDSQKIVEYTIEYEKKVEEDRALGIKPWYEDAEWQAACAFIESQPEHWEGVETTEVVE